MKPVPAYTDTEAIVFLYEKYAGALYGLVNQVWAGTNAVNETFVEVFATSVHSINQYDSSKSRLFTWMMQKAGELAIEKLKDTSPRIYLEAGVKEPGVNVVGGLILSLQRDEQQVMTLAYLRGYSVEEMTAKLRYPLKSLSKE